MEINEGYQITTNKWQDVTIYFCIKEISLINSVWKNLLSPTTVIFISFATIIKSLSWCSEIAKQHQKWILQPQKPHYRGIIHHFVISGSKTDFLTCQLAAILDFFANNKNCPKVVQGQLSWNSSRTPKGYESAKKVIGKNIPKISNRLRHHNGKVAEFVTCRLYDPGRCVLYHFISTTISNAFSWMTKRDGRLKFHWSHYLNKCWPSSPTHICGSRGTLTRHVFLQHSTN